MRFITGFLAGVGAAWAALAIWQQLPPFRAIDDIDPDDVPDVCPEQHTREHHRHTEGRII